MSELTSLQLQYGDAVFQIARYERVRDLAKAKLDELAEGAARQIVANLQQNTGRAVAKSDIEPSPKFIHTIYANPPYGIFSRVARQVGVSPSFARKVALGLQTSKRVATVLIAEGNRIAGNLQHVEQKRGGAA